MNTVNSSIRNRTVTLSTTKLTNLKASLQPKLRFIPTRTASSIRNTNLPNNNTRIKTRIKTRNTNSNSNRSCKKDIRANTLKRVTNKRISREADGKIFPQTKKPKNKVPLLPKN